MAHSNLGKSSGDLLTAADTNELLAVTSGDNAYLDGQLAIGHSTAEFPIDVDGSMTATRHVNTLGASSLNLRKSRGATFGDIAIVLDNDILGNLKFFADDGTDLSTEVAKIRANVDDATPAENAIGGDLTFWTATTAGTLTSRMTITNAGLVDVAANVRAATGILFGTDTAAANTLDDYEEGTFTATLGAVDADPTTPVTTTGYYTKMGDRYFIDVDFINVSTVGASGEMRVRGLPETSNANFKSTGPTYLQLGGSIEAITCYSLTSDTEIGFIGQATATPKDITAGSGRYVRLSICYKV